MSKRLQELKLREMETPEPPPEIAERVWRGVERQLASGEPPLELSRAPLVPTRAVTLKLILGGALVLLGVVGAAVVGSRWRAEQAAPVSSNELVEDAPAGNEREVESEVLPSPPIAPVAPRVATVEPPELEAPPASLVAKPKPKPEPPAKPRTLTDEVALIQSISRALKQGEWKSVLKLVAQHEREFPKGQFVEEREAAKVRAQCRSGAIDGGQQAAERFGERWPSSIHRATIRQDCDL